VVLSTGGRSEQFAQRLLGLPELAYVEMGIFTGHALRRCVRDDIARSTLAGMIGKFSKLAQGHFQTHVAGNQVDLQFLSALAADTGVPATVVEAIRGANTARHVQELLQAAAAGPAFYDRLCALVQERSHAYVHDKLDVDCILFDFDGAVLGSTSGSGG
jgi:cobalt-precorrin-5B (C1)-methyltransferase